MRPLFGILLLAVTLARPCFAFPPPGTLILGEDANSVLAGPYYKNRYVIYEVPASGASPVVQLDLSWDFLERPLFWQSAAGVTFFADVERGYVKVASSHTPRAGSLAPEPAPIGAANVSALARFGDSGIVVYDSVSQEAYSLELEPSKQFHRYNFPVPDYVFPSSTREVVDMEAETHSLSLSSEMIMAHYLTDLGIVRHELIRDTSDPSQRPQVLTESTKFFPLFKQTISLPMGGSLAVRRPLQMKKDGSNFWVMADAREDGSPVVVIICYRLDFASPGRYSVEHVEDITLMQSPEMIGFMNSQGQNDLIIRDGDDAFRLEEPKFQGSWSHNAILSMNRIAIPSGLDVTQLQNLTQSRHPHFPKVHLPHLSKNSGVTLAQPHSPASSFPWVGGYAYLPMPTLPFGPQNAQNQTGLARPTTALAQLINQAILPPGQQVVEDMPSKITEAPEVILQRRAEFLVSLCWKRWRAGSGKILSGLPEKPEGEIGATAFAVFLNSMEANSIVAAYKTVDSHQSDLRAMGINPMYPYSAVNFGGTVQVSKLVTLLTLASSSTLPEDPNSDCDSVILQ